MNTSGLKYFVFTAQSESISKAAKALYITQPALSRNLQRLENELGVRLFERRQGKLTSSLTHAGELCLKNAKQILFYEERLLATVRDQMLEEKGTLSIGYCGSEAYWLYELVNRIRQQYPRIEIRPHNQGVGRLERGILDGALDLVYLDDIPKDGRLKSMVLEKGWREIIVGKRHPLAERTSVQMEELVHETYISWDREIYPHMYEWFCELCRREGAEPRIEFYDNTEMLFSALHSCRGFAIGASAYRRAVDGSLFRFIPILSEDGSGPWEMEMNLVWNRNDGNPCLSAVLKEARKMVSEAERRR